MGLSWQLQEAKNKFSEVVEKAIKTGPQEITRRGKKTAVVLSMENYLKMKRKKNSLVHFFRSSPLKDIDLERTKDLSRNIEL